MYKTLYDSLSILHKKDLNLLFNVSLPREPATIIINLSVGLKPKVTFDVFLIAIAFSPHGLPV